MTFMLRDVDLELWRKWRELQARRGKGLRPALLELMALDVESDEHDRDVAAHVSGAPS